MTPAPRFTAFDVLPIAAVRTKIASLPSLALGLALATVPCAAWYDPTFDYTETPAVAARFPDPATPSASPGLRARGDFTGQSEMEKFLADLAKGTPEMKVVRAGESQEGRAIPLVVFARPAGASPAANGKPTVLVVTGQRGNEPAAAEAGLALVERLATGPRAVLDRINVLVVPRANPDGAHHFKRGLVNGVDLDRDHLLQGTPESRALGRIFVQYAPAVVVVNGEFAVRPGWLDKFGALPREDVLIRPATPSNLPPAIAEAAERLFRPAIARALDAAGFVHARSYATSFDASDRTVSGGTVLPDSGVNVAGLRNAAGFAIESRGADLGRAHFRRRIESHLAATGAILAAAASNAAEVATMARGAREGVVAAAGNGEIVVAAAGAPAKRTLAMLDPQSGADKAQDVDATSPQDAKPSLVRSRPRGYLLPASQSAAAGRLAGLGVRVLRVDADAFVEAERFRIADARVAATRDARTIEQEGPFAPVALTIAVEKASLPVKAGDLYVPLDQPLANLVVAALEPDTPASYASNYVLAFPPPRSPERFVPAARILAPLAAPASAWSAP